MTPPWKDWHISQTPSPGTTPHKSATENIFTILPFPYKQLNSYLRNPSWVVIWRGNGQMLEIKYDSILLNHQKQEKQSSQFFINTATTVATPQQTDVLVSELMNPFFNSPFYLPDKTLYLHIPVSRHSLISKHRYFWKGKLEISFVYSLS